MAGSELSKTVATFIVQKILLDETGLSESCVDPDTFIRWTYAQALSHRQPRYEAMSKWGVTITPADIDTLKAPEDFTDLIARHLPSGG